MKTEPESEGPGTPCRLVERLVGESLLLFLVLQGGREIELDRRRPGSMIDPEGIATICKLIESEVPAPHLLVPQPGELGVLGYQAWERIHRRLCGPGNDPASLMPVY